MNNESVDNQVQALALVGSGNAGFVRRCAAGTSGHDGARAPGGGCLAVRSEGMVTVVTEKESLSEGESALLLTLCEAHTGVSPEGVKVICTGSETK